MNEEYGNIPDGFLLNPEEIQELRTDKEQTDMCLMDWEAREWDV